MFFNLFIDNRHEVFPGECGPLAIAMPAAGSGAG